MNQFKKMTYPYVAWISVMVVLPMLMIVFYAFTKQGNSVASVLFSFENFVKFITDADFLTVLGRSLKVALETTVICVLLGYPAAYFIAKCSEGMKMKWVLIITFPTWINMLVRTYAWMGILDNDGILVRFIRLFGANDVKLLYTDFAVILGMVYNFLPFMILQIYTSLTKMDRSLLEAAQDLGASKQKAFMRITLPLSLPGVISGITLVFLPAVSSFFIPKLLGGGQYVMIGNLIEKQFLSSGDWHFGSAVSLIMVIIIMASMWLTRKLDKTEIMEQKSN